jgi:hypothetical protein
MAPHRTVACRADLWLLNVDDGDNLIPLLSWFFQENRMPGGRWTWAGSLNCPS